MSTAESTVAASRALDDLYRTHAGEVYRYAYAVLGNHADAEDVTQTTFVNALRALERGERPRRPSNWLIAITHNVVRQRFRQQQARPVEVELDRDVPAREPADRSGPSIDELVRALQRLPESQREALVLRELEGRSYSEIAHLLDISKNALETLLFRARRSLADEVENAATCERAALDLSRMVDGRLSRKQRKRLDDHIAECPSCKRLQLAQDKRRRAFKGLAVLPLPLSLTMFKGAPTASAATGLPTMSTAGSAFAVGGGATGSGIVTVGGLAVGAVALKAAAVVAAATVASGAGYVGTRELSSHHDPVASVAATARLREPGHPRLASAVATRVSAQTTATVAAVAHAPTLSTPPSEPANATTAPPGSPAAPPGATRPAETRPERPARPADAKESGTTTPRTGVPPGSAQTIATVATDADVPSPSTPASEGATSAATASPGPATHENARPTERPARPAEPKEIGPIATGAGDADEAAPSTPPLQPTNAATAPPGPPGPRPRRTRHEDGRTEHEAVRPNGWPLRRPEPPRSGATTPSPGHADGAAPSTTLPLQPTSAATAPPGPPAAPPGLAWHDDARPNGWPLRRPEPPRSGATTPSPGHADGAAPSTTLPLQPTSAATAPPGPPGAPPGPARHEDARSTERTSRSAESDGSNHRH